MILFGYSCPTLVVVTIFMENSGSFACYHIPWFKSKGFLLFFLIVHTEEQDHLQDLTMWQLFMMIKLFLYLEEHRSPSLWMTCTLLTLRRYVEHLLIFFLANWKFVRCDILIRSSFSDGMVKNKDTWFPSITKGWFLWRPMWNQMVYSWGWKQEKTYASWA